MCLLIDLSDYVGIFSVEFTVFSPSGLEINVFENLVSVLKKE